MSIRTAFKAAFSRPFSPSEMEAEIADFIAKPPLPAHLYEWATSFRGSSGETLLEYWRATFRQELTSICEAREWRHQRSALLRQVLRHSGVLSVYSAASKANHPESWFHYVRANPLFQDREPNDPGNMNLLLQWWVLSMLSYAGLIGVGGATHGLDDGKALELKAYQSCDDEIRSLDVSMMDLLHDYLAEGNLEVAQGISELKDQEVNPIVTRQFSLLFRMGDDIVNSQLDVDYTRRTARDISAEKDALRAKLLAPDSDGAT